MSNNDMMTAIMASSKLPLNPKTKVYDETEEPKKIQGNIFFRNQIRKKTRYKKLSDGKRKVTRFIERGEDTS